MFLLCLFPLLEAPIEAWFELKKKLSVNHFWTAVARGILMFGISLVLYASGTTDYWWQGLVLCFGLFFTTFNYLYNVLTKRKWDYLRDKGIDGWEKRHVPIIARVFVRAITLAAAIQIYVKPTILWSQQ